MYVNVNKSKYSSIVVGYKPAKCWGGGEKRAERGEAGYKLTADLDKRTKKLYEKDKWALY